MIDKGAVAPLSAQHDPDSRLVLEWSALTSRSRFPRLILD